jgi:hypothetical protein
VVSVAPRSDGFYSIAGMQPGMATLTFDYLGITATLQVRVYDGGGNVF